MVGVVADITGSLGHVEYLSERSKPVQSPVLERR